jgi:hypothetical protein
VIAAALVAVALLLPNTVQASGTPAGVAAVRDAFGGETLPDGLRVLFLGNSFTRQHDVPAIVSALAAGQGQTFAPAMITRDGARLADLAADPAVEDIVRLPVWDVLVLQDHSTAALSEARRAASDAAIREFAAMTDARIVLVATWPRARDHALYARDGMPETPEAMNRLTASHYATAARAVSGRVAGVGHAFLAIDAARPDAGLHAADGYHASAEGARLAASVIAAAILRAAEPAADPDRAEAPQPAGAIAAR